MDQKTAKRIREATAAGKSPAQVARIAEGGSDELRGKNQKGQLKAIGAKDDGTWKDIKGE